MLPRQQRFSEGRRSVYGRAVLEVPDGNVREMCLVRITPKIS